MANKTNPDKAEQLSFAFGLVEVDTGKSGPERLDEIGVSAYQDLFNELMRQGWRWQKAAYMAWRAAPRDSRTPATQAELAKLLGYAGDKTFRNWLNKPDQGPQMEAIIRQAPKSVFEAHLADVDWVTICQAKAEDSSVAARELFYKRHNDVAGETGQDDINDTSRLTDDQIEAELQQLEQLAA